jgi:hypothetical protein
MIPKKNNTGSPRLVVLALALLWMARPAVGEPAVTHDDVLPILQLRCTICHGARVQEAGLDVRTRASLLKGGKSGPALVPGKPAASLILKRVLAEEMPPHERLVDVSVKRLSSGEIERLRKWIELDAPEVPTNPGEARRLEDEGLTEEDRQFWSFRPLPQSIAVPPQVTSDTSLQQNAGNSIDAFILARLASQGLEFSEEADSRTLIRRATFDLTGLPPEPREVDAFVTDTRPDAYPRLVERLLGSRRYGERWGRYWLDLAGYADTEGKREQDVLRPHAYRYRDYVIRAYNSNKPFDRFLHEQIAGDELADYENAPKITPAIYDNLVATGFLRMSPDPTWANITGFVPDRLDVIADAIDVLGSSVLGLPVKCARCHEHRFDPISQEDYYRLTAILKGAYDEHDWLKPNRAQVANVNRGPLEYRNLPFVEDEERVAWEALEEERKNAIAALKASLQTAPSEDEKKALEEKLKELEKKPHPRPLIRALWDRGEPSPTFVLRRGNYLLSGRRVEPGVPTIFERATPMEVARPNNGSRTTGRRLSFAKWLTRSNHPLTARVHVNHLWKHHFRHGLVKSLGNFGRSGVPPTHPDLLDWLAREFVDSGWDVKGLHRLIMTSRTYRQSSAQNERHETRDPGNDLLSRFPLKRIEAEVLRDTLLLVAGRLDETPFGPADEVEVQRDGLVTSVGTENGWRRSVYIQYRRRQNLTILENFDLPQMNPNCLERKDSTVAPQALHLMNNAMVRQLARSLAERLIREARNDSLRQIEELYRITLSRFPSPEESTLAQTTRARLLTEWKRHTEESPPPDAEIKSLADLCHVLINSAEFIYVD